MEYQINKLSCMLPGETGEIVELKNKGDMRRRLIDLGFSAGSLVSCVGIAPLGEPKAYLIKGSIIALREDDSKKIIVNIN